MNWPNPQDYNEAIQSPASCFADPQLRDAVIELSPIGLPRPITGAFASVYKVFSKDETLAVRCFHSDIPELPRRYSQILSTFDRLHPDWAAKTQFIEKGIRVGGSWFPVVKMNWIDALPLDRYLAKHGANQIKINGLVQQLRTILSGMNEHGIAHGDLQHGNILMFGDEMKLIDYDGVFVPELAGLASAEIGHANYQHPYRSREHFGSYIDNFPAWLITISLMSIAADPELLEYSRDRECLLFAHADLIAPYESQLFARLREHPKEEIRNATHTLNRLLSCPVEFVPTLDATDDELLNLPEMDPGEQMRLIEEIAMTEQRFVDSPPVLAALEKLSTTKRGSKDRLGLLFRKASTRGSEILSSVLQQKLNSHDLASKGDSLFANGDYQSSIEAYVKAVSAIENDRKHVKKTKKPDIRVRHSFDTDEVVFNYDRFEDELNLRLGTCQLLNNNPATAVFHYKEVMKKHTGDPTHVVMVDVIVGLMMAYCQLKREQDAVALIEEQCSWKTYQLQKKAPNFSANNLASTLLNYGNGPLATAPGLSMALSVVASFFLKSEQYERAASLFEAARALRKAGVGSTEDLDLALKIGHCHLLNRRPDLAHQFFNIIIQSSSSSDALRDRAAIGIAVAFKIMNSRQDVVKAMRARMPQQLFERFKEELKSPIGDMEELADVISAFAAELGESEILDGLRMAVRLAADNYQRLDEKKIRETIVQLLEEEKFSEADKMVSKEMLQKDDDLRKRFFRGALVFARSLTTCGAYEDAFAVLDKYDCPCEVTIEAMEGQIIRSMKAATRTNWNHDDFQEAMVVFGTLCQRDKISDYICKSMADLICESFDRTDEFLADIRLLADLMAGHSDGGSSNSQVLRLRMFALEAEAPDKAPIKIVSQQQINAPGKMATQFVNATRAGTVTARSKQYENEALALLKQASQKNWEPALLAQIRGHIDEMKRQRGLTVDFCDRLASILLGYLTESSSLNRWSKEGKSVPQQRKDSVKAMLNGIMDTFSTVAGIDPNTLRKLQRAIEKL